VLSGTLDGRLRIWDVVRARCVRTLSGHANRKFCLATACIKDADGRQLVLSGSEDHAVYVWDANSGEQVNKLAGHDAPVLAVAAHPSGEEVVAGANTKITTWHRASASTE
jgi:COMPASS component SWD3